MTLRPDLILTSGSEKSCPRKVLWFILRSQSICLPILRKCTKEKGTTKEIMPKDAFLRIFRAMLKKAGYFCGA